MLAHLLWDIKQKIKSLVLLLHLDTIYLSFNVPQWSWEDNLTCSDSCWHFYCLLLLLLLWLKPLTSFIAKVPTVSSFGHLVIMENISLRGRRGFIVILIIVLSSMVSAVCSFLSGHQHLNTNNVSRLLLIQLFALFLCTFNIFIFSMTWQ